MGYLPCVAVILGCSATYHSVPRYGTIAPITSNSSDPDPPPGITSPLIPAPHPHLSSARPFLPRGGVSDPAPVAAGGDRRPRRRNLLPRAIATRVRPPSRGAVRETRRHYDRLCVWRTVRALGSRRARQGEARARRPESGTDGDKSPGGRVGRALFRSSARRAFRVQPTRPPPSALFAGAETTTAHDPAAIAPAGMRDRAAKERTGP